MEVNIKKGLKGFHPHLLEAREKGLKEAETQLRVIGFLQQVLCYDPMSEIALESVVNDRRADIALKIDGKIQLLIEVKAASIDLKEKHIAQAKLYAAEAALPWVVLTNGLDWILFHLSFGDVLESVRAFTVDLSQADKLDHAAEDLALLHRSAVAKGALDDYWQHRVALTPEAIGRALFNESVLKSIRHKLHKTEKVLVGVEDLARSLHDMLSVEAREEIGPLKIHHAKARHRQKPAPSVIPSPE